MSTTLQFLDDRREEDNRVRVQPGVNLASRNAVCVAAKMAMTLTYGGCDPVPIRTFMASAVGALETLEGDEGGIPQMGSTTYPGQDLLKELGAACQDTPLRPGYYADTLNRIIKTCEAAYELGATHAYFA